MINQNAHDDVHADSGDAGIADAQDAAPDDLPDQDLADGQPDATNGESDGGEADRKDPEARKALSRRRVLAVAGAAVVVAAVGAAGAFTVFGKRKVESGKVEVQVELDDWYSADGIAFLRFAGTGGPAQGVERTVAVLDDEDAPQFMRQSVSVYLTEGTYDVSLAASPVYTDGTVFYPDADVQHIDVSPEGKPATVEVRGERRESPRCVGAPLISSDDVREFKEVAEEAGVKDSAIAPYADAFQLALDEYLAAELEGRVPYGGEGEPLLQVGSYNVVLSSYWYGKVEVVFTDQGFTVYPTGLANAPVLEAMLDDVAREVDENTDLLVRKISLGNRRTIFITAPNYVRHASTYAEGVIPDDVLSTCLDLMSGGTVTLEEARQTSSSMSKVENFMAVWNLLTLEEAVDEAFEELKDTTAWLGTVISSTASKWSETVTYASFADNRLVLFGSMARVDSVEELHSQSEVVQGPRVWAFAVSDSATFEAYGGIDGPEPFTQDEFFTHVTDLIGLGMRLQVVDGVIVHGELAS